MYLKKVIERSYWSVDTVHNCYLSFPWSEPRAYANYLAQIYYYVDHATRLLSFAAAKCKLEEEHLHLHFIRGIHEEKNHEEMARQDIQALGFRLEDFEELPETSAYYQTLHYMIDAHGPSALLGYFIVLEGLAAEKMGTVYEYLCHKYGEAACSFLKEHCILDQKHFHEGLEFFETCTDEQLKVVDKAIVQSAWLYCGIFDRIKKDYPAVQIAPFSQGMKEIST